MKLRKAAMIFHLSMPLLLLSIFVWQLSLARGVSAAYGFTPLYTYSDPLDIDISPTSCTGTGWDLDRIEVAYDENTDVLSVNYSTHGDFIFGDVDGDGNPANFNGCAGIGADYADLGGGSGGEAADFVIDVGDDGSFEYIAGIASGAGVNGITVSDYTGPSPPGTSPGFNYGTNVVTTAAVTNNPSTTNPDFEFTIDDFAVKVIGVQNPGDAFTFCFVARVGSFSDGRIGEDNSPSVGCHPFEYPKKLRDFGDLPDVYGTFKGSNGARHVITDTLKLGAGIDAEGNGQPNAAASGDDLAGNDDEDGVSATGSTWSSGSASLSVDVSGRGCLLGWIDWLGDGNFQGMSVGTSSVSDLVVNQFISASGPVGITTPTLQDYNDETGTAEYPASLYARFRLVPPYDPMFGALQLDGDGCPTSATIAQAAALTTGEAGGGEVEDYLWNFKPTAVSLRGISVDAASGATAFIVVTLLLLVGASLLLILRQKKARAG